MSTTNTIDRAQAKDTEGTENESQADIVFCIDATGSMEPCIRKVKSGIRSFTESLQEEIKVDFRLRMIAYRDLHDDTAQEDPPWKSTGFTRSVREFKDELSEISATGGGDFRTGESTLDALYRAIHSDWRTSVTHKTIVLLTDDNTHSTLHESTYDRPDNNIERVIQDFQSLRHAMLFMVAPDYPAYKKISGAMESADRKIFFHDVPKDEERYEGLKEVPLKKLLDMIGESVSSTLARRNRQQN